MTAKQKSELLCLMFCISCSLCIQEFEESIVYKPTSTAVSFVSSVPPQYNIIKDPLDFDPVYYHSSRDSKNFIEVVKVNRTSAKLQWLFSSYSKCECFISYSMIKSVLAHSAVEQVSACKGHLRISLEYGRQYAVTINCNRIVWKNVLTFIAGLPYDHNESEKPHEFIPHTPHRPQVTLQDNSTLVIIISSFLILTLLIFVAVVAFIFSRKHPGLCQPRSEEISLSESRDELEELRRIVRENRNSFQA